MQRDRTGQDERPQTGTPDQHTEGEFPKDRDVGAGARESSGCQASQVISIDWYSRLAKARHIASPFHQASPWSFEIAREEINDAHVDLDQPQARFAPALGEGPPAGACPRRTARHRSIDSAFPLGPMARYNASMALIWSRPKVAAGTR